MVQCVGKYVRTKEENYENFLKEVGLGMMMRKAATVSTPSMEIKDLGGGKWSMVTSTTLKSINLEFEFGKPFNEKTTDGRECITTVTKESDNVWITNQKAQKASEKSVKVTRTFTDEGIDVVMECGSVASKQFYKRQ